MGSYERGWVEEAEKSVCAELNGNTVDLWASRVATAISSHQPSIVKAKWKGREDYLGGGDVILYLKDGGEKLCELKFSHEGGSGTAKNLGSRTFTKKIHKDILSYADYDIQLGYKLARYQLVEQKINRFVKTQKEYNDCLRSFREFDPDVLKEIANITAPGQIAYAQYASECLNNYLDKVNYMVKEILPISGTRPANEDMLYCVTKNWMKSNQTTEFYDFKDMDTKVVEVQSSGKSIQMRNSHGRNVLTFSVTWKNICQGGATPCFNVFFGNALG